MDTSAWYRRRQRWLVEWVEANGTDPVCVACGAEWRLRTGDLHHRSYGRLGHETWRDLMPLCRACHRELHRILEHDAGWRRLGREQASDVIAARLRARNESAR